MKSIGSGEEGAGEPGKRYTLAVQKLGEERKGSPLNHVRLNLKHQEVFYRRTPEDKL